MKRIRVLILAICLGTAVVGNPVFAQSVRGVQNETELSAPPVASVGANGSAYKFKKNVTATKQLKDLFTTIDIMDATVSELTNEMEAGNVTSKQLTQMYIDRINAYDSKLKLNSVISINPNALKDAQKLDKERKKGKIRGPLHGIPIIVKDNIDVSGVATSGGSLALAHMVVKSDAYVVKKLRKAGAVILAKANLSEFASSATDSESLLGGTVHNAYDTSRVPAGSSGGTGVAITANFATVGLGTDTGGSIRNPSSYSNLYGIRPSKGLTSIYGVIPLMGPRDTVGPMARTAEDMALVLEVMAGTDKNDDFTVEANADKLVGSGYSKSLSVNGLKGKRIGYLTSSFETDPTPYLSEEELDEDYAQVKYPSARVDAMVKKTRANLRKAGAEFVDLSNELDDESIFEMWNGASDDTTEYDFNKYLNKNKDVAPYKTLKALYESGKTGIDYSNIPCFGMDPDEMADSFEETYNPYIINVNGFMRGESWQNTLDFRKKIMGVMKKNNVDAIMYIASLDVAPTYANYDEQFDPNDIGFEYGYIFGPAVGLPEAVIPMGFSDTDESVTTELPLGMRLIGKFGDEKTLMQIAYAYEQQAGSSIRKIPQNTPALKDKNLESYLDALMIQVYSIDYSKYNKKPKGEIQLMKQDYLKAANVDTSDPYATYKAAKKLAKSYDKVMKALKKSGLKK